MAKEPGNDSRKNYISYTVARGESLTSIVLANLAKFDLSEDDRKDAYKVHLKAMNLARLNDIDAGKDNNYPLYVGQNLLIPSNSQQIVKTAMASNQEKSAAEGHPIKVGSIIHLQNQADDSYLDMRGWVGDKHVITNWKDPHISAYVSTHKSEERFNGSGSWKILSASGKPNDQPLVDGDRVYLLNMHPNAGYLDTFEWVRLLEPFRRYSNMTIGVFTSSVPRRGGGVSGIWSIRTAVERLPNGEEILESSPIYLENLYPGAGYLVAHGDVSTHELFNDYGDQRKFVFTTPHGRVDDTAYTWKIMLSENQPKQMPNIYHVWNESSGASTDVGYIELALHGDQPISSLFIKSSGSGKLIGEANKGIVVNATWVDDKDGYLVSTGGVKIGVWQLGGQIDELIFERHDTNTRRIEGTITYKDKEKAPVQFKAIQVLTLDWQQFFESTLWESRVNRIQEALKAAGDELDTILKSTEVLTTTNADMVFLITQLTHIQQLRLDMEEFWELFGEDSGNYIKNLNKVGLLPPVHLIKASFQQFTVDFEILQSAIQQRRWSEEESAEFYSNAQAKSLIVSDKLASKALTPFQHLITDSSDVIPITYFSQTIHIRRLPYVDNFVLVGITYDLSIYSNRSKEEDSLPFELMAIPHEVGHFIYHYGKLKTNETYPYESFAHVRKDAAFLNHPYYHWFEEIFADLYGCMVAGPLTALGLLALLATGDKERILSDDDAHPTPILRPYFLSEMLRILSERSSVWGLNQESGTVQAHDFSEVAKSLDANWTTLLERWGYETEGVTDGRSRPVKIQVPSQTQGHWEEFINVETAVTHVRLIINKFVDLLDHHYKASENKPQLPRCNVRNNMNDYITYYAEEINNYYINMGPREDFEKPLPSWPSPSEKIIGSTKPGRRGPKSRREDIRNRIPSLDESRKKGNFEMSKTIAHIFRELIEGWHDSGPSGGSGDHL